ncbi:MAG: hypothetical protein AAGD12_02875 [Pseudomonadota bacterium]
MFHFPGIALVWIARPFAFFVGLVLFCLPVQAETLLTLFNPKLPEGRQTITLTRAELMELPQATVRTSNEFVDGTKEFVGPLARDVVAIIGHRASTKAKMTAINDYSVTIDLSEFNRYDVILAMSMDGALLSPRDKGPIWLIYPMGDHPELQDPIYNNRLIWQLVRIELQ